MPEYTVEDFAARVRNRYNAYHDLSDIELVDRIIAKYPVYAEQITNYQNPEDRYRDEQLTEFVEQRFDGLTDVGEGLINLQSKKTSSCVTKVYHPVSTCGYRTGGKDPQYPHQRCGPTPTGG